LGEGSRSEITFDDLHQGIMLCLRNARAFLEETQILAEKKHLRHSIGLLGLAVEEMGKAQHFADVLEIAAIEGEKVAALDEGVFWKHKAKLEYVPKPFLRESKKERRLRAHLKRYYTETPALRARSFYVDFRAGRWLWGNPELEKLDIVSFIIKDLSVDCDWIQAQLYLLKRLWRKIRRYGRHDERTQNFVRKYYGTDAQERINQTSG